jgi:hypothetical protein
MGDTGTGFFLIFFMYGTGTVPVPYQFRKTYRTVPVSTYSTVGIFLNLFVLNGSEKRVYLQLTSF